MTTDQMESDLPTLVSGGRGAMFQAMLPKGGGRPKAKDILPLAKRWPVWSIGGFLVLWGVLAHLLPHGLPAGIVALGLVFGSFYALIAIGLVLVYRANRILNFAAADVGVVAGVITIELVVQWRVNYFLAVAVGLIFAAAMGALINAGIIRRFRRSSRLILTAATIGVDQVLAAMAIIIPVLWSIKRTNHRTFESPFKWHFSVWPVLFSGDHVVAIIGVVGAALALAAFLRFTSYGIGIRAAAENNERAILLGIPVPRLDTIVWSMAAVLSALAVILRVPILGFNSFSNVSGSGNALLVRTLAAAVIARMDSIPKAVAAALGIGVYDSLATWTSSNVTLVDASLVGVIVLALLVQRKALSRMVEGSLSTFRSIREVRAIPAELAQLPEVRYGVRALKLLLIGGAIAVPVIFSPAQTYLASLIVIYAIVGISLLVLTGWANQISLGQFALAGFGGATTALLFQRHGWDYFLALLAGIAASAVVALIIGLPALRIRGLFLAVTTLAFGISASEYFLNGVYLPWFVQGSMDRPVLFGRLPTTVDWQIYYVCLAGLLLAIGSVRSLRKSRIGRAIIAVRDNEPAAMAAKINPTMVKLTAFVISGALAGLAGGLYVTHEGGVYTNSFNADASIAMFLMVVIGGLGSLPGVILGAVYVWGAGYLLHGGYTQLATGVGILFLLIFFPEGLGGIMYGLRDTILRRIAVRRSLVVPSLLADQRTYDVGAEVLLTRSEEAQNLPEVVGAYGRQEPLEADPELVDLTEPDTAPANGAGRTRRATRV